MADRVEVGDSGGGDPSRPSAAPVPVPSPPVNKNHRGGGTRILGKTHRTGSGTPPHRARRPRGAL